MTYLGDSQIDVSRSRRLRRWVGILLFISLLISALTVRQKFWLAPLDANLPPAVVISSVAKREREEQSANNSTHLLAGSVTLGISPETIAAANHPFDPLLEVADQALKKIDETVFDYSATLTSQVLVDGRLREEKSLECKIRHARLLPGGKKIPFSVYTKFLKPQNMAGQEVIWVDGWHQGNLVAHLTGWTNVMRFYLDPDSQRAMEGNRYPIREIGFRNLIVKMQEVARNDREYDECLVRIERQLRINDRPCTMIEATHPDKRPHFEFHIARIYIDDERNLPVAYEGYLWPEKPGDPPVLLEKYYYTDIKLNVGLKDKDFDPANEAYNFPGR